MEIKKENQNNRTLKYGGIINKVNLLLLIYFFLLIFSFTTSGLIFYSNLGLLILGMIISILMMNKVTKSSNSLKLKIYFCFIICFALFFAIICLWFLGDHYNMDEKGIGSLFIISTSIIFGLISFIVGLILSIKRRHRKDLDYNFKLFLIIITLISLILIFIVFYNPLVHRAAVLIQDEEICTLIITTPNNYVFDPSIYSRCISELGILKNNERICESVCQRHEDYIGYDDKHNVVFKYEVYDYRQDRYDKCEKWAKSDCYLEIAKKKIDINLCDKTSRPENCYSAINTLCTKRGLPIEICGRASEGGGYLMEFEP